MDFNAGDSQQRFDVDDLSRRLAACADSWAPQLFANGIVDGDLIRVANIRGDRPRKRGSCVINLADGSWFDHDPSIGRGGQALSTLKEATGLDGVELLKRAAELTGHVERPPPPAERKATDPTAEINHILEHAASPSPECRMGIYLASRGLDIPDCPDLLFNGNVTDWKGKVGRPAMIAIVRNAGGERTGIHRTYLSYDGADKADMPSPRMMLGEVEGGAVRLTPAGADGVLAIAEGIETALSVTKLFGVPCWAVLAARFIGSSGKDGAWSGFDIPKFVKSLIIFADAGKPGKIAAELLKSRCEQLNLPCEIAYPRSSDDFNVDLRQGLWHPGEDFRTAQATIPAFQASVATGGTISDPQPGMGELIAPSDAGDLAAAIATLTRESTAEQIESVLHQVALAGLGDLARKDTLKSIKGRTGKGIPALEKTLKRFVREINVTQLVERGGADWLAAMICNESGEPKPILENVAVALERAVEWQDVIWLDEFSQRIMMRLPAPWIQRNGHWESAPWTDEDNIEATRWLQRAGVHVGSLIVHEAIMACASRNPYHPVRDFLDGLQWDGAARIDKWLPYYLGAEDSLYVRAVGARWLIGAVARIYQPGIKMDTMLVLEGPQALGKSSALRMLFDPWFADEIPDLGSKDAAMQLLGVWCIEFAELDAMRRVERNRVKAFLSRANDRYRPPYGRYTIEAPRQCVFAGSVNEETWLDDPTGARRFWPVKCAAIDLDSLWRDRAQLWAEATQRFRNGEKFYLAEDDVKAEAEVEQEARQQDDAWLDLMRKYLDDGAAWPLRDASVAEILQALSIPRDKWGRADQIRIAHLFRKMGWTRYRETRQEGDKQGWRYRRPN